MEGFVGTFGVVRELGDGAELFRRLWSVPAFEEIDKIDFQAIQGLLKVERFSIEDQSFALQ